MGTSAQMITGRALEWLRNAVLAMFVLALLGGLFLPVYTDEIGWRFQTRAGFDGVDKMFSELCGPNTLAAPPFFMWPARWYSAGFNGLFDAPAWIRLSGISCALAWVVMTVKLAGRLATDTGDRVRMLTIGIGLLALGVMPLLFVWSRPEQPILLAATLALLVAMSDAPGREGDTPVASAWLRSLLIAMLAAFATSYHLKGLFVLPLLLLCLLFASRGRAAHLPRIVAAGFVIVVIVLAGYYWNARLGCPDNARLAADYAGNSIAGNVAGINSLAKFATLAGTMIANVSVLEYIVLAAPRHNPLSSWLAPDQLSFAEGLRWFTGIATLWYLALALSGVALVRATWMCWQRRMLDKRVVLASGLLATVLGWSAMQLIRNVYEAILVLPLLSLAIMMALSVAERVWLKRFGNVVAVLVGLSAVASPVAITAIYAPSLAVAASQVGLVREQPVSVSIFGYSRVRSEALAAGRLCGIAKPADAHALMIDDASYFAYIHSGLPQHQLGVIGNWSGGTDPLAYLKARGSSGAVVTCRLLPPDMRAKSRQHGEFCCLGPPGW